MGYIQIEGYDKINETIDKKGLEFTLTLVHENWTVNNILKARVGRQWMAVPMHVAPPPFCLLLQFIMQMYKWSTKKNTIKPKKASDIKSLQ